MKNLVKRLNKLNLIICRSDIYPLFTQLTGIIIKNKTYFISCFVTTKYLVSMYVVNCISKIWFSYGLIHQYDKKRLLLTLNSRVRPTRRARRCLSMIFAIRPFKADINTFLAKRQKNAGLKCNTRVRRTISVGRHTNISVHRTVP